MSTMKNYLITELMAMKTIAKHEKLDEAAGFLDIAILSIEDALDAERSTAAPLELPQKRELRLVAGGLD